MSDLDQLNEGGKLPILIRPGRTFRRTLWLREADGITPIPLDSWAGAAQVRDGAGRLLLTLGVTVSQVAALSDPTCGQIDLVASASTTAAMAVPGRWDLVLSRGSGSSLETRDLVGDSDVLLGLGVTRL